MATVDDIDTKTSVEKFLRRGVITSQADGASDTGEEIQELLDAIATTLLLFPQSLLPLLLRSKNLLRQVVDTDIQAIDFVINAIGDIQNPEHHVSDLSDLIEAKTALIELDKLGRSSPDLRAYTRYSGAVDRFLDQQLAPFLKRNAKKEFERSGSEAREDIATILPQLAATHSVMIDRLGSLQNSVADFRSVDLNAMVSSRTISEIRTSLDIIRARLENELISFTTAAIDLLAGAAALQSISSGNDVYDATIDTGVIPSARTISLRAELVAATVLSEDGPWDLNDVDAYAKKFTLYVDPVAHPSPNPPQTNLELPDTDVKDSSNQNTHYVTSSESGASATYEIPVNGTLFMSVEGVSEYEISLTSGTRTVAQILAELNAALNPTAAAAEFKAGSNRFVIYVTDNSGAPTGIVIFPCSSGSAGAINTDPSVHSILGFGDFQTSLDEGVYDVDSLIDSLSGRISGVTLSKEGDKLRITSDLVEYNSSLYLTALVANSAMEVFGFPLEELVGSAPSYMELVEDGTGLIAEDEGVYLGGIVTATEDDVYSKAPLSASVRTLNNAAITSVDETKLSFSQVLLPRGVIDVLIESPIVLAVQSLINKLTRFLGEFDDDMLDLQQVSSPIVSSPTPSQISDALRVLNDIRDKLTNTENTGLRDVLDSITLRRDREQYAFLADRIIQSLEERGLNRAADLLLEGKITEFFALTKNVSSDSSRFLRAMEEVISNDVPMSYIEQDIEDGERPIGDNEEDIVEPVYSDELVGDEDDF
jgi:hypothetical protein